MNAKRKAKDQILHLLKMGGAQTAVALAEQLQVSPMAVRQHLQALQAEQWVTYCEERRPTGRPVKRWQLTAHSGSRFADSHADLMLDLLRGIETLFGSDGLAQLIADRRQRQVQGYQEQLADTMRWQDRVAAIAQLRSQEGYMAEVIAQPNNVLLLVENHCPICSAAQACPGLCHAELDVFRDVLGDTVIVERVEHLMAGDRRCTYRICHP